MMRFSSGFLFPGPPFFACLTIGRASPRKERGCVVCVWGGGVVVRCLFVVEWFLGPGGVVAFGGGFGSLGGGVLLGFFCFLFFLCGGVLFFFVFVV